jgi:hypothetical protein
MYPVKRHCDTDREFSLLMTAHAVVCQAWTYGDTASRMSLRRKTVKSSFLGTCFVLHSRGGLEGIRDGLTSRARRYGSSELMGTADMLDDST